MMPGKFPYRYEIYVNVFYDGSISPHTHLPTSFHTNFRGTVLRDDASTPFEVRIGFAPLGPTGRCTLFGMPLDGLVEDTIKSLVANAERAGYERAMNELSPPKSWVDRVRRILQSTPRP